MKHLLLSTFALLVFSASAQWSATNLTNVSYLAITATESHQGGLYSIVFNGISGMVYTLDAGNASWTPLTTNVPDRPAFLRSAGNRLYLGTIGLGYSMLYYTEDNGATYVVDTAGLPEFFNGIEQIYGIQHFGGNVVVNLGSAGYWIKRGPTASWDYLNTPTALNGGADPVTYLNGELFAFEGTGNYAVYTSSDEGMSWNTLSTNLPSNFNADVVAADTIANKLYAWGSWNSGSNYGLKMSADFGATWTDVDLSAFLSTDHMGGAHEITTIHTNNEMLHIGFENEAANTQPNVVSSTNGVAALAWDTIGLANDPAGTVYPLEFIDHDGQMACALTVIDVYLKGAGTGIADHQDGLIEVSVFPNPATHELHIEGFTGQFNYQIFDITGRPVRTGTSIGTINVNELQAGHFHLLTQDRKGQLGRARFIKR